MGSEYYPGELSPFLINSDKVEISFIYLVNILAVSLFYLLFIVSKKRKFTFGFDLYVNNKRLNYLMFVLLIINFSFILSTGVGVVGSKATSPFTPLVFLFKPDVFFYAYFLLNRAKLSEFKQIFIINLILFALLKLTQGWSGFILFIFFLELYHRFKGYAFKSKPILSFLFPVILIVFGGVVYSYVYVIKNEIRGTPVDNVTYLEGVIHLANRLSILPVAVGANQNFDKIVMLFNSDEYALKEVQALFRPLVPSIIMPDKNFRMLNNNIIQSFYPNVISATSSNVGLPMYASLLASADLMQFFIYLSLLTLFVIILKLFYDSLSQHKGQLDILYLFGLINIVNISSLEVVFSYGFFSNLTVLFACICLKVIKIRHSQPKIAIKQ